MNSPRSPVFFGGNQHKYYRIVTPAHVVVSSKEVEEAELPESPKIWSCMCRASESTKASYVQVTLTRTVIKSSRTKFALSGITLIQTDYTRPYIVPINPNMARIGGRKHNLRHDDVFTQFYAAAINRQPSQFKNENIGFVVHAHCWVLLNHVIPTTLVEREMEKFIHAAQEYWHESKLWGSNDSRLRLAKYCDLLHPYPGSNAPFKYGCDIYKNPLIVPEMHKAIDRARKTEKNHIRPRDNSIPLDIAIIVAELICPIDYTPADLMNTRNMLAAFQWTLPDGFWKRRLKEEDILFELELLRKANYPIDWQSLRLDLMALVSNRHWYHFSGLANRVRVLGFMTAIASNFLNMPRG
ncbi:uncharacterized protein N7500_000496 [Penicillium coprophilum]|uniref:uncharacterized protein n=1 Tax=Penicillium coprophilum TaxID=36646 RepID=UPI0023A1F2D1|nr:uncharacterized protein N7500_000496 [Penicillium coprophilum]KAJ5177797.1 hypothetical protein N7500_000496 [Penicillium coprophilum]